MDLFELFQPHLAAFYARPESHLSVKSSSVIYSLFNGKKMDNSSNTMFWFIVWCNFPAMRHLVISLHL